MNESNTVETPTVESAFQLERERIELVQAQQRLTPLPSLPLRRDAVADAQAALAQNPDEPTKQLALDAAQRLLVEAVEINTRYTQLGNQISKITERIAVAQQRERQQSVDEANSQLEQALNEWQFAALQAAKAYRNLLNANHVSMHTLGAKTATINSNFNIPHLAHDGGKVFPLGQQLQQGYLPWENKPARKEAA